MQNVLAALITPGSRAAPGYDRPTPRDRVVDVGFVALGFGLGSLALDNSAGKIPSPHWLELAVCVATALSLVLRRSWPIALTVALIVLSIFFPPVGGPSGLALFSVAIHTRPTVSLSLCAAAVASGIGQFWLFPPASGVVGYWAAVGITSLGCLVLTGWGIVVRTRRELMASLTERAIRAESEQKLRVEQGQRQERERIAREMHDALGHRLSLLSVHAGAVEFRPEMPADELARMAGVIRGSARDAVDDLREIVGVLRSAEDGPRRGLGDLDELVKECRSVGMEIDLAVGLDLANVPDSVGRHGYRIAQEGLTNARKHAPGQPVRVVVDGTPRDGLTVEVSNPLGEGGAGPGSRVGLIGLAKRASLAGGWIEHEVTPAGDFRLAVWLPWPETAR